MNILAPIFAANINIIEIVVILLFLIVPAIGQLLAKLRQMQPPAGAPRPPRPVPVDVADEIEVFMRRVLGEKVEEQPPVIRDEPSPIQRPVEQPVRAELVAEGPGVERVEQHVDQYLDTGEFANRTSRLGGEVAEADEQFEQHVHRAFDHNLSQLDQAAVKDSSAAVAPAAEVAVAAAIEVPATVAAGLVAMLSNAESVAQAIILSEIIHRPEERWT